jgi:CxxC motif-containing protein (DUF1111 family)
MSRILCVTFLAFVFACTDQTEPPAAGSRPDDVALENDASGVELELNVSGVDRSARTALSGGATTTFENGAEAFETAAPNLSAAHLQRHEEGDDAFGLAHVPGAGVDGNGGLGPVFDNVSCEACHLGDGRGRPPENEGGEFTSMLFRASVSGRDANGGPLGIPGGFGGQLQTHMNAGYTPDITAMIHYVETQGTFADGTPYQLHAPQYTINGAYPGLPATFLFSPRVAPVVFGLGLLEAVPELALIGRSDPRDLDRDGISGRVNLVYDAVRHQRAVGRFGWKANTPNLIQQTAGAYNGDMGVTSDLFPSEPCAGRNSDPLTDAGCNTTHAPEVTAATVADVAFYTQTLAVPARRNLNDPTARRGETVFYAVGCDGCHTPTLRTGFLRGIPEVSNQVIHPYTDLLIHDMGPGLADGRPDFQASGSEWRTAPLWGIGLVFTVNGHTRFLHDGRAYSLQEAVLWHGGEATRARDRFTHLAKPDRDALLAFLQSL